MRNKLFIAVAVVFIFWRPLSAGEKPENLILITIDTLRSDHVGAYGYTRKTTPYIDAFAQKSLLFTRCYSHASYTNASISSLLTGKYPHENKIFGILDKLPNDNPILCEYFNAAGFQTAGIVSNYFLRKEHGFARGFQYFDDQMSDVIFDGKWSERSGVETTDAAIRWLDSYQNKPFFLWVHYQDPHGPYNPPAPFNSIFSTAPANVAYIKAGFEKHFSLEKMPDYQRLRPDVTFRELVNRYDEEIRFTDQEVGRFLAYVAKKKLMGRSLVILTADHGEAMGERGFYFQHMKGLSPGLTQVPLIIHCGSHSGRIKKIVKHHDVFRTMLDTFRLVSPGTYRGVNLLARSRDNQPVYAEGLNKDSLVSGPWQLIRDKEKNEVALFRIQKDPLVLNDLSGAAKYKPILEKLSKELEGYFDSSVPPSKQGTPIPADMQEHLKSLGYMQ